MTTDQMKKIKQMRMEGQSHLQIASTFGISINTIKSYCRRNNITSCSDSPNIARPPKVDKEIHIVCKNCGKPLIHETRGKPKKFCSEHCRRAWWKFNESHSNKQAWYTLTCAGCGNVFKSYGNKNRKFCSHSCYIMMRYT